MVSGTLERIDLFNSNYTSSRPIEIWLPDGSSESKKYSVLYMHDGQMLFDSETSWNQQSWDVDDVATQLFESQKVNEFILVGI